MQRVAYRRRAPVGNRPVNYPQPAPAPRPAPMPPPAAAPLNSMYFPPPGTRPPAHMATMLPAATYMTLQTRAGPVTMAPLVTRPMAPVPPPAPAPAPRPAVMPRRPVGGPLPRGLPPGNYRRVIARRR